MRISTSVAWHNYEFGNATVLVKSASPEAADGLTRFNFHCQVHPAVGGPIYEVEVSAFYAWDAANRTLDMYNKSIKED